MIMEEVGWVDVKELPATKLEIDAAIVTSAKDGSHSLYCAVIVKRVDEKTRAKVGINELLRDV